MIQLTVVVGAVNSTGQFTITANQVTNFLSPPVCPPYGLLPPQCLRYLLFVVGEGRTAMASGDGGWLMWDITVELGWGRNCRDSSCDTRAEAMVRLFLYTFIYCESSLTFDVLLLLVFRRGPVLSFLLIFPVDTFFIKLFHVNWKFSHDTIMYSTVYFLQCFRVELHYVINTPYTHSYLNKALLPFLLV